MKLFKTILFSLLLHSLFLSDVFPSTVYLSLYDDSEFMVVLGNTNYDNPVKLAEFNNINGGSYYLEVYKRTNEWGSGKKTVYKGYIKIPDNSNVYSVIDESNNYVVYKKLSNNNPDYSYYCNCNCENCRNCKQKHNEYNCDYKIMNNRDFADLKKLISDRTFESTKIEFAKSGIDNNYFSTDQVRELLMLFTFESTKLDLAKYVYSHTCDKKNYYRLFDIFTFESNVVDLKNFITNHN
jgi:hypothetical protein